MELTQLSPEQITAIGGVIALILGALGFGSWRAANRPIAPVSNQADASGLTLFIDPKRADLLVSEMGAMNVNAILLCKALTESTKTAERAAEAAERLMKSGNGIYDAIHNIRDDLREHRDELRDSREALRQERAIFKEQMEQMVNLLTKGQTQ